MPHRSAALPSTLNLRLPAGVRRSQRFAEPEQVKAVGRLFRTVAAILREGQETGELRRDLDADIACNVFIGGLDIVLTSRVLGVIDIEGGPEREKAYYLEVARANSLDDFRNLKPGTTIYFPPLEK